MLPQPKQLIFKIVIKSNAHCSFICSSNKIIGLNSIGCPGSCISSTNHHSPLKFHFFECGGNEYRICIKTVQPITEHLMSHCYCGITIICTYILTAERDALYNRWWRVIWLSFFIRWRISVNLVILPVSLNTDRKKNSCIMNQRQLTCLRFWLRELQMDPLPITKRNCYRRLW